MSMKIHPKAEPKPPNDSDYTQDVSFRTMYSRPLCKVLKIFVRICEALSSARVAGIKYIRETSKGFGQSTT